MSLDPVASRLAHTGVAFASQIESAGRRHGLNPNLLAAVAAQETGGPGANAGHNIVGDGGHGHGLFQIDDRWHPFASTKAAMDPAQNADYAAGMLSGLLKRYGGNVHEALSAYNSGSPTAAGTKTQWADGADLGYADSVLRHYVGLGAAQLRMNRPRRPRLPNRAQRFPRSARWALRRRATRNRRSHCRRLHCRHPRCQAPRKRTRITGNQPTICRF
jgi:hypothetical protein